VTEAPHVDNPALTTALKAFSSLTKEQRTALSRTLEGFVACLAPSASDSHANPHARTVITEEAWNNRANWERDEWNAWETWGWYRQFCRAVSFSMCLRIILELTFCILISILLTCKHTQQPCILFRSPSSNMSTTLRQTFSKWSGILHPGRRHKSSFTSLAKKMIAIMLFIKHYIFTL